MNLTYMILPMLLLGLVGIERGARQQLQPHEHNTLAIIGVLAVVMAMLRGFYWDLFGRDDYGPAANKGSALAVFFALIFLPEVSGRVRIMKLPMGQITDIMCQPVGAAIGVAVFLVALVPLPGVQEALFIGAGLGNLFDPLVVGAALITAASAKKSWHVMIGASIAAIIVLVEPRSAYLEITLEWQITSAIGAACIVAVLAGLGAQLRTMANPAVSEEE